MRLRRGGRSKDIPGDATARAETAVVVPPDEPGPIRLASPGSVVNLAHSAMDPGNEVTDEWGLYDPDIAGVGALISTIDLSEIPAPEGIEEDPSDLLLRQQEAADARATDVFKTDAPSGAGEAAALSPAAAAVAACRVGHLAPLSLWARLADAVMEAPVSPRPDMVSRLMAEWKPKINPRAGSLFASSDLAARIGRLTHPAHVATTSLSAVCRIRGIQVAPVVVIAEPPEELPCWPPPALPRFPETSAAEPLESAAVEAPDGAETPDVTPLLLSTQPLEGEEPVPSAAAALPTGLAVAAADCDTDAQADPELVAVAAPDAFTIDLVTSSMPGDEVTTVETHAFDGQLAPPVEFDVEAPIPCAAADAACAPADEAPGDSAPAADAPSPIAASSDSEFQPCPQEPDPPSLSSPTVLEEVVPEQPAAPVEEAPPEQLAPPVEEVAPEQLAPPVEEAPPEQLVARVEEAAPEEVVAPVVNLPPPAPLVFESASHAAPSPVRKRRRAAMALG